MDRILAMQLFTRVAEVGSFSGAARELSVSQPTVSKQVAALEDHLGAQLLHRTTRRLILTDAGRGFYEAAVKVLTELSLAESSIGRGASRPSGLLRISLSAGFGRLHLVPLLPAFHARYPDIVVDIIVSDRFVGLVEDGIDLAIRIAHLPDSSLVARRIGTSPRITVAAPDFLKRFGEPQSPNELDRYDCVAFTFQRSPNPWVFGSLDGPQRYIPKGPVRANDAENVRAAVLAGLGIAQAPRWLFAAELASGQVREVLGKYPAQSTPIHAVFPAGGRPAGKVRVFVDFVVARFAADPDLRCDPGDQ